MLTNILYALPYQNSARDAINSGDYVKAFSVIESIPRGTSDGEEIQRLAVKNQLYGLLVSNLFSDKQSSEDSPLRKIGVPKALEYLTLIANAIGIKSTHDSEAIGDKFQDAHHALEILTKRKIEDSDQLRVTLEEHTVYSKFGSPNEVGEIVDSHKKTADVLKDIK